VIAAKVCYAPCLSQKKYFFANFITSKANACAHEAESAYFYERKPILNMKAESPSDFSSLEKLFEDDEESLKEVFYIFLQDVPKNLAGIRSDCEGKDWGAAAKKAHQLKPFYVYAGNKESEQLLETLHDEFESVTPGYDFESKLVQLELKTEMIVGRLKHRLGI
jgi:HPt (histidine-containing phosphotransfer) domain-containing protein